MTQNLTGKLIECDADFLDVENRVAGDLTATAQVGRRGRRNQRQGRPSQAVELDARQARAFVDPAFAHTADARRVGRPARADARGDEHSATIVTFAPLIAPLGQHHRRRFTGLLGVLVANRAIAGNVRGIGVDRQDFRLATAVRRERRVKVGELLDRVRRRERRGRQRR